MDVVITDLPGITKAALHGRLDTVHVNNVETYFVAGVVPKELHTVVDLSSVSFIASLGIRMLLSTARALGRRGAKFAMYGATPPVLEIIETTALGDLIPVLTTEAEAIAVVTG